MTADQIRKRFLEHFSRKGHAVIPSASVVPDNDPSALFISAGMHPLVPYLMGEPHPAGTRLVDVQKCIRTGDIDEVGDNRHLTFFEMLGNWSLGDYFKKETIAWSWEFIIDKEKGLGFDPKRVYVSVFAGDENAPRDEESAGYWKEHFQSVGISHGLNDWYAQDPDAHVQPSRTDYLETDRIFLYPKKKNWWGPAGQTGPCGPDTEMFYDTGTPHNTVFGPSCHPNCDCGRFIEFWNDVFMEFNKNADGTYQPLKQKNVDTGMGLERVVALSQGKSSVYETELFLPIIEAAGKLPGAFAISENNRWWYQALADHIRAAGFMIADGVRVSNVDQGYILRRVIRRAVRYADRLGIRMQDGHSALCELMEVVISVYGEAYPELIKCHDEIIAHVQAEEEKFQKALNRGLREFEKIKGSLAGKAAFDLYQSYGFPLDMTQELAKEAGIEIDRTQFEEEFKKHQDLSRSGAEQKFKGGLADASVESTRYHTATHLLHRALKDVLGDGVNQKGSNITPERLRFDFNFDRPMTPEEIQRVEDIVNTQIARDLPVHWEEMSVEQAREKNAIGLFGDKYGEKVKVYFMGDYSTEICGGPHVSHTGELAIVGKFKILKEESSSAGVRRIKAVLQK